MPRMQRYELPKEGTKCVRLGCVYNEDGQCDGPGPAVNKGNSDAECYWMPNKVLAAELAGAK